MVVYTQGRASYQGTGETNEHNHTGQEEREEEKNKTGTRGKHNKGKPERTRK